MATNAHWWKTSRTIFGALGAKTFFVDWDFGSDITGDGTPEYPYATIGYGYVTIKTANGSAPSGCVVRGHGNETFVGDHSFSIVGDEWGAAVYDGGGTSQIIYCSMSKIIVLNAGNNVDVDYSISSYSGNIRAAFAGCGRASSAGAAHSAYYVYGCAASPILIENSKLYRGCIGGTTAVKYDIFSKIKCTPYSAGNDACGVSFGGYQLSANSRCNNCTVYDLPLSVRAIAKSAQTLALHAYRWIFGKVDFIYEHNDVFYNCLFLSDCKVFFVDQTTGNAYSGKRLKLKWESGVSPTEFIYNSADTDLDFTGTSTGGSLTVSGEGITSIYDALVALYSNGNITADPTTKFLQNCVFSTQSSTDVFNNPEKTDFTIKPNCAAVIDDVNYYGALPPALNIPIFGTGNSGSDGHKECWDNRSISGCVKVESAVIKLDTASNADNGEIRTKIIACNPSAQQYNGLFAKYMKRIKRGWIASIINPWGTEISTNGATLDEDTLYVVKGGSATFDGNVYSANDVIDTTDATSLVLTLTSGASVFPVKDANIPDTLYCRCRSMIYAHAQVGDSLKQQVTYLNDGSRYIKFHNRVIIPGESFICDSAESFSVCDSNGTIDSSITDYTIAVVFDDRETIPSGEERIGGQTKWIPAQMWGEYFAMKNAGSITELNIAQIGNVPKSSGNYQCFTKNGGGAQINGYKSILNQTYMQFALFISKVSDVDVNAN